VKVLHWINKIAYPFKELHSVEQTEYFAKPNEEVYETTPFFRQNDYRELGSFFANSELRSKVLLLSDDPSEIHDSF